MDLFTEAMNLTLGNEGGWYDGSEPRDPNPTMWGITQKTYDVYRSALGLHLQSVRAVATAERDAIYRKYWDGVCEGLPRLAAFIAFDMSINAGPAEARKCIQRALNLTDDGVFGRMSIIAICNLVKYGTANSQCDVFTLRLLLERVVFYRNLARNERLRPNLNSWVARVADFYTDHVRHA